MTSQNPVIEINNVYFSYDGSNALEEVNLKVPDKDFLAIVGPNGGGKTTLIKLILGLLKPQEGSLRVFGVSPAKARTRLGYMPQHASLQRRRQAKGRGGTRGGRALWRAGPVFR
jgi:zinc transport system ATP-binding protein